MITKTLFGDVDVMPKARFDKKAYQKEYRKNNKKDRNIYYNQYRKKNIEKEKIRQQVFYRKNIKKIKERLKEYRKNNPKDIRDRELKRAYGLTLQLYNEMLTAQNNVCAICGKKETIIHNKSNKLQSLAVDHCHKTKKIRGLLCWRCNSGIGYFKDNINYLKNAINYLELSLK